MINQCRSYYFAGSCHQAISNGLRCYWDTDHDRRYFRFDHLRINYWVGSQLSRISGGWSIPYNKRCTHHYYLMQLVQVKMLDWFDVLAAQWRWKTTITSSSALHSTTTRSTGPVYVMQQKSTYKLHWSQIHCMGRWRYMYRTFLCWGFKWGCYILAWWWQICRRRCKIWKIVSQWHWNEWGHLYTRTS